jgi:hypothetical protein
MMEMEISRRPQNLHGDSLQPAGFRWSRNIERTKSASYPQTAILRALWTGRTIVAIVRAAAASGRVAAVRAGAMPASGVAGVQQEREMPRWGP